MKNSTRPSSVANTRLLSGLVLFACTGAAWGQYDYCVTRTLGAGSEIIRARLHITGDDPGPEASALHVARHYRRPGSGGVRIEPYEAARCAAPETQDIALAPPGFHDREPAAAPADPNLGRLANVAGATATGIAAEASRLMCRLIPC